MVANDMSDDDSVLGVDNDDSEYGDTAFCKDSSPLDDDGADANEQGDDDDDEVPEVEEEEEDNVEKDPPKKGKCGGGIITQFFNAKQGGGSKEPAKQASSPRKALPPIKAVPPMQPLGASRRKGTAKALLHKATSDPLKPKQVPEDKFSFNDDSGDDDDTLTSALPTNSGYGASTATVDAEQEFEDAMRAESAKAPALGEGEDAKGTEPPCVHESAKKRRYVMKNEKTKKWCEFLADGLEYAPECGELFELSMEALTISSKKERLVLQTKLVDDSMSTIHKTMCIAKIKVDGLGSGSGPGITNLMGMIPVEVPLDEPELADVVSRMKNYEAGTSVVMLLALDHDIVKRVFKVANAPLPAIYNPNTHSGNKYKVPLKLEEQNEIDDNFVWIGAVETRKRASKRSADEGGNSKADAKRQANGTASSSSSSATATTGEIVGKEDVVSICGDPTTMKAFADKDLAVSYTKLSCAQNEVFTILPCGNGNWLLLKSLA